MERADRYARRSTERKHAPEQPESPEGQEIWVIDGLEDSPRGRLARLELPGGHTRVLPLSELPVGVQEGDVLAVSPPEAGQAAGGREWQFRRLEAEAAQRRAEAQAQLNTANTATPTPAGEIDL